MTGGRYGTVLIDEAAYIATNVDGGFYRPHVEGSPRTVTSRRIRRNALRELKRRLRWGKGAGKVTEWKTDSKGRLVPITRRALSFAEAIRTMDVERIIADDRVGEPEMALLYATQGWRP